MSDWPLRRAPQDALGKDDLRKELFDIVYDQLLEARGAWDPQGLCGI